MACIFSKSLNGRLADIDGNILFTGGVETGFTGKVYAIWTAQTNI
jgi:hypothetical protein